MDVIQNPRVAAQLIMRGETHEGYLHLMMTHMFFRSPTLELPRNELWTGFPLIQQIERRPYSVGGFSALRVRCRDFSLFTLNFQKDAECAQTFDTIRSLTCVDTIDKLYAFSFKPNRYQSEFNSWTLYSAEAEFKRQGLGSRFPQWRFTKLNHDYSFSPTYPALLAVPSSISDNVLSYGAKYRSKARLPVLTYIHSLNGCSITRASQPMVGLKQNRSLQDEKLVLSIFDSTSTKPDVYGATGSGNLIVDARPTTNAMANVALGAGTENMDHYPTAKKVYLGIDNIHVMRDSLNKVIEAIKDSDLTPLPPNKELLHRSNWLKHISQVLDGSNIVASTIHIGGSHVLVHCSDGWDRTSQLCSLAELALDPYYRTLEGFFVLIEKDWLSFGHRFAERSGHLASEKSFINNSSSLQTTTSNDNSSSPGSPQPEEKQNRAQNALSNLTNFSKKLGEVKFGNQQGHLKYTSPIFHQFLDCVFQMLTQFPTEFEFNERLLRRLLYHTYSCQYGTFLHNNERERKQYDIASKTRSVWDLFLSDREKTYVEPSYAPTTGTADVWLKTDTSKVKWWAAMFCRTDPEMNSTVKTRVEAGSGSEVPILGVEYGSEVPAVSGTELKPSASGQEMR